MAHRLYKPCARPQCGSYVERNRNRWCSQRCYGWYQRVSKWAGRELADDELVEVARAAAADEQPTRERRRQHAQDRRAEHIHDLGLELDAWSIMDDRRLEAEAAALLAEQSPQRVEAPACVECGATESVGLCRGEWRCGECLSRASARGRQNRARTRQNGR